MFEELSTKIKAQLYDRAGSPLIWAYLISWISWNFRTVILIFGKGDFDAKIKKISVLYPSNWDYFLQGICYPLASSATFIAIYPFLAMLAFWHWHTQHKKVKKIQQKIEDETPATQEEINTLRKASLDREAKLQEEIGKAYLAIKEYKLREDEIQELAVDLNKQIASLNSTIKQKNEEILNSDDKYLALETEFNQFKSKLEDKKKDSEKDSFGARIKLSQPKSTIIKNNDVYKKAFHKALNNEDLINLQPKEVEIIIQLAVNEGELEETQLRKLNTHLSKMDWEVCLENLDKSDYIYTDGFTYYISSKCKRILVKEGLTNLQNLASTNN